MQFLKILRRRSVLSELVYVGLNVALALAVLVIVRTVESPIPAFILVMLSKWRVFAVRPRYWLANIQANLVDFILSISVVVLMYSVGVNSVYGFALQIFIVASISHGWCISSRAQPSVPWFRRHGFHLLSVQWRSSYCHTDGQLSSLS